MIPCIIEQSLNLFTVTADERFNLGSDIFLRTHSTTTMRRFRGSNQIDSWTEKDFLESLLQKKIGEKGNRVYVLYGAAGSGKTEMIRWLQCQLNDTPRSASFLRISRTELDPVKILEKLLRHFTGKGLDPGVLIHWDALKNKPVTLANHLVWSALGRLFENDEQIIPISYKLRPIIEENLKQSLCRNQDMLESLSSPELISLEQLEALIQESCIHLDVDCEQLRHLMGKELEQEMLGGYNFSDTLRRIGQAVYSKTGHRPLLFIDDLVQSLNVYATELLDYFITLDEGNWDIILGLTPASFETTRRGKEILNRITNLDTFDDRITKLWFSDERGSNSFFLSEENCAEYLALYLEEAKRQSGYNCGRSCTHVENCRALLSQTDLLSLLPFNTSCIRRLFRKIPRDKGRPRHFITSIGETLSLYINHKYETAWTHFFEREYVPNHSDSALRLLFSVYSPIDTKETEDIAINPELVRFFFPEIQAKSLPMSMGITSLLGDPTIPPDLDQASVPLNPTRETIRDWLDEKPVNKELLRDVRQGIASVLRDIVQPMNVGLMCNSRPNTAVHKEDAKDGCKFALRFQGVDESQLEEVEIGRSLGHSAFFFESIQNLRGHAKERRLLQIFSNDAPFSLIHKTSELRLQVEHCLAKQLGMKPSAFAYCCFQILVETGQAVYELPPFHKTIISKYPKDMEESHVILPGEIINLIYQHFRDWFLLRENIYDGPRLFEMRRDFQNQNILNLILSIDAKKIDPHYKIGNYQLPSFLEKLQSHVAEWLIFWQSPIVKAKIVMLEKVHEMLEQVSNPTILEETRCHIGTLSKAYSLPAQRIPEWQDCHQLLKDFNKKWAQLLPIHRFQFMDLEKNPLYIHRCLILIRILEDKDNYNLFQFEQYISSIANYVEAQHAAIKKSVVEKHLACYSDWSIELNESIKCGPYISMLQSIVGKAISLVSICSRIDFLIAIQPYVKDDFVENAKRVSNALSSIPSSSVPGEARSSIVKTIKYCTRYISLVQSLNTAEAKNEGIPEWQRASEKLSNISLLTDLKLLCRQLHLTYRIRLLVISTILPDETIFTPTLSLELNIINSLDSALDLVNKLDEAIQALPTMDYIMSTVSPQTTQEVKDFLVSLLLGSSFNSPIELLSHETLSAIQQLYPRLYAALQVSITAGKPMPW